MKKELKDRRKGELIPLMKDPTERERIRALSVVPTSRSVSVSVSATLLFHPAATQFLS